MQDTEEYYSYLNIDSKASPKEIKESYLKLSRILHPDKQHSQYKPIAEKTFTKIKYYTDVLLNPTTRYIYDNFGETGIDLISNKKYIHKFPIQAEPNKLVKIYLGHLPQNPTFTSEIQTKSFKF